MILIFFIIILFVHDQDACSKPPKPLPRTGCNGCCDINCCLDDNGIPQPWPPKDKYANYCGDRKYDASCQCYENLNTRVWDKDEIGIVYDTSTEWTHLSTAIFFISDLANDSGMLQSSLFTKRSQNLLSPKLPSWGFWRYGQFFK